MNTIEWIGVLVLAILMGPILLGLFVVALWWWLDQTLGRVLDWFWR